MNLGNRHAETWHFPTARKRTQQHFCCVFALSPSSGMVHMSVLLAASHLEEAEITRLPSGEILATNMLRVYGQPLQRCSSPNCRGNVMNSQKQKDSKKPPTPNKTPGARPGGQTDSATGARPGGGGQSQGGKKK
jgi:hypothetical protein